MCEHFWVQVAASIPGLNAALGRLLRSPGGQRMLWGPFPEDRPAEMRGLRRWIETNAEAPEVCDARS